MYRLKQFLWAIFYFLISAALGYFLLKMYVSDSELFTNGDYGCLLIFLVIGMVWVFFRGASYVFEPHERLGHYFASKRVRVDDCVEYVQCRYCSEKKYIGSHNMIRTFRDEIPVCEIVKKCTKCGKEQKNGTDHKFSWTRSEKNQCLKVYKCEKCGEVISTEIDHLWGNPVHDEKSDNLCKMLSVCIKCGEEKTLNLHTFKYVDNLCVYEVTCSVCGVTEWVNNSHTYDGTHSGYCTRCGEYTGCDNDGYVGYY